MSTENVQLDDIGHWINLYEPGDILLAIHLK